MTKLKLSEAYIVSVLFADPTTGKEVPDEAVRFSLANALKMAAALMETIPTYLKSVQVRSSESGEIAFEWAA